MSKLKASDSEMRIMCETLELNHKAKQAEIMDLKRSLAKATEHNEELAHHRNQCENEIESLRLTVDAQGQASSRMVLCKEVLAGAGAVVFYTNYDSRKAGELAGNPRCALLFHWDHQGRQVRIEGRVTKAPDEWSDAYFASLGAARRRCAP